MSEASFAESETASLNSVATDLSEFISNANFWAPAELPRQVDLKPILNENEERYFNYRQSFSASQTPDLELSSVQVDKCLDPHLYPRPERNKPMDLPRAAATLKQPANQPAKQAESDLVTASQEEDYQFNWKALLRRAKKVLSLNSNPQATEQQIQFIFELLLKELEKQSIRAPKCAARAPERRGEVLKSLPRAAVENSSGYDIEQQLCQESPEQIELQQLQEVFGVPNSELLKAAKQAKQTQNQLFQLRSDFQQAALKLQQLALQSTRASEFQQLGTFSELQNDFTRRAEVEFSAVEQDLLRAKESERLRRNIADIYNISTKGQSIYDIIKQNNDILAKIQLEQSNEQNTDVFVAAEEFAERCAQEKIGLNPAENSQLITYADTVLAAAGAQREQLSRQCVKTAAEEHPKILIRLTDEEAYQAFEALLFVFTHFSRLFGTLSVGRMICRLTEVENFCQEAKTLIAAEKRILGLNQNCSATKLLEAVEAVASQAADEAGVLSVEEAKQLMNILNVEDCQDIISAAKALKEQAGGVQNEEGETSESD